MADGTSSRPRRRDPARRPQARRRCAAGAIGVFNVGGEFFALSTAARTRAAASAAASSPGSSSRTRPGDYDYTRQGEIIRCPWHGWEFDIRTGQSWCDPRRPAGAHYAASVEPGASLALGPYVAETFEVRVEDDYVVLEL